MSRIISNVIKLAVIKDVNYGTGIAHTQWVDQPGVDGPDIPIPHPYASRSGEGMFVGLSKGNIVALDIASYERHIPVAVVPMPASYGNLSDFSESVFDDIGFPQLESGDIVIQGTQGAQLRFNSDGMISLKNDLGEGTVISGFTDDSVRCSITTPSPMAYTISHSGMNARGVVRRDVRVEEWEDDFVDFLTDADSEQALEEVGWDSSKQVTYVTRDPVSAGKDATDEKRFRNPGLIEDRSILFEYGRAWAVGDYSTELDRMRSDLTALSELSDRREKRNSVLNLSLTHPNELIEKVSGTLVDMFGNLLDLNKNILPTPQGDKPEVLLDDIFEISRHTIAYHMEINTRKGLSYREGKAITDKDGSIIVSNKPVLLKGAPDPSISANNARDRSRWAFRVDKEGLTTLNIPASSETGNVPLLTRQENSSTLKVDDRGVAKPEGRDIDDTNELFRNETGQDIFHDQFGPGGVEIKTPAHHSIENRLTGKNTSWVETISGVDATSKRGKLPKFVEAGTAFHDITKTALLILENDINKNASNILEDFTTADEDQPAIATEVDPRRPKPDTSLAGRDTETGLVKNQPNAGGRSAQINLDGSLEMSVGANTIDRVSWVTDTAGSIVARLGRDRYGRSAIIQTDGGIVIDVGGFDFIGEDKDDDVDSRFVGRGDPRTKTLPKDPKKFRSGQVVMRIRRSNPSQTGPDTDDNLVIIDETGITFYASGRLNLVSGMDMTLKSESRVLIEAPKIQMYKDNPKFVRRDGRNV